MAFRKSSYRKPPTHDGLLKIEKGTMEYLDEEMWSNVNTGTLEQFYNERTRIDGFARSRFVWKHVIIGIMIGMVFAAVNQYVGLKVGMIVSGAWYLVYLLGLMLKWEPTEVNIASGASTGASQTCVGLVFAFPAIYLLAMHPDYAVGRDAAGNLTFLVSTNMLPPIWVIIIPLILGSWLGVMYFTIFRRVWLVEDPLPVPGFESSVKLVDIAKDISRGSAEHAKHAIRLVFAVTGITMFFTFLRDFPVKGEASALDAAFGGETYAAGEIIYPNFDVTFLSFAFIPIQFAIGWFMKFKTALLINLGTFFTWLVIVPLAISQEVPIYVPADDAFISVAATALPAMEAYKNVAKVIAIGAILGGGITALIKMAGVFKTATADIFSIVKGEGERTDFVPGYGWFEWPMSHVPAMIGIVIIGIFIVFSAGGFPVAQSFVFVILLVAVSFFLGAIGVKVMGETGSTPVSGTSFIVVIMLIGIFKVMGTSTSMLIIMTLVGASIFGTALSLSSDIINDFKIGIYAGTRPYHLVKGEMTAIPFGAVISVIFVFIFSEGLATGTLNLYAPQANTFAKFIQTVISGSMGQTLHFLIIGVAIGIIAEISTGMGTAFGLGMYLPLGVNLPLIVGGGFRDWWEKKVLEPKAKAENWSERQRTLKLVDTYMMATGLIIGEALMGTVIAIYLVLVFAGGG